MYKELVLTQKVIITMPTEDEHLYSHILRGKFKEVGMDVDKEIHKRVNMNNGDIIYYQMDLKKEDVVIEKGIHSTNVKFVEAADETGILLVGGHEGDMFFLPEEFDCLAEKFMMFIRKEDREDLKQMSF